MIKKKTELQTQLGWSFLQRTTMKRYLNLEQAVAACVQSNEGSEAHVSEEDIGSEDSPWSQEDSGEYACQTVRDPAT